MSSDTMYFNSSRMLPSHNKNSTHMTQAPPFSLKKSKSNRKSLELVERKSEKPSRSSTPVPENLKSNDIPRLQTLPNGERPNFGNSSNINVKSNDNNISHSSQHKTHSRKKSANGKTHKNKDKDGEKKPKSGKKDKTSGNKKEKSSKHESTEVITNNLKQLLLDKNKSGKATDTKKKNTSKKIDADIHRVQNSASPLTTFMTSPIITPGNIPPQLKINNNSTALGQPPLMVTMQHHQQFNHQNNRNVAAAGHNNNNNTHNNIPMPLNNGMMNSPIMHPLTPFQMSNTIPPYPFGNNNLNYSISNMPLPMPAPSYVSPQPIPPQHILSNGNSLPNHNNMMNRAVDISGGGTGTSGPVMTNNNINKPVTTPTSANSMNNYNKSFKNNKNVNKKMSHSFAGASFTTDIPQESNLPKPSFL